MKQLEYSSFQALKQENERLSYKIYSLNNGKMDFSSYLKDFKLNSLNKKSFFIDRKNKTIYEIDKRKVKIKYIFLIKENILDVNNKTYYIYK